MSKTRQKARPSSVNFYIDGKLYKKHRVNRPANLIYLWDYAEHKLVQMFFSDFLMKKEQAWTITEAGKLLGVTHASVRNVLYCRNVIDPPQRSYSIDRYLKGELDDNPYPTSYWLQLSNDDVRALREYYSTTMKAHDKLGAPYSIHSKENLPTAAELEGILANSPTLYVKGTDGEFAPVFAAPKL